jgi:excisionase family DNA binding protein
MSEQLSITDVARDLGVNEKTVRRWIKSGELHAIKDILGRYRISRPDLDEFVRRRMRRYNDDGDDDPNE